MDTITKNNLTLEIKGCSGYLSNGRVHVRFHYIGHHPCIKVAMVSGYYKHVDSTEEFANLYNKWYDDLEQEDVVYGTGSDDDPNVPIYAIL
eukprot:1363212-Amphidinium_carterae.1